MRNITIAAITATLLFGGLGICPSTAQSQPYKGTITVQSVRVQQKDKKVYVEMDVVLKDVKIKSPQGIDLIPVIEGNGNVQTLPELELKGGDEYLSAERKVALMSKKKKKEYEQPYEIKRVKGRLSDTLKYRYEMPYEAWMENAQVDVLYDWCGCGKTYLMDRTPLGQVLVVKPYQITPHMAYVRPEVEVTKVREKQAEAFLDFVVNKVDIRPDYMNNPTELAKIHRMIDELRADPDISISSLNIIGYASPEGTLAANKRLSEGRARALRTYLNQYYEFSKGISTIEFGGENWDGLVKALENSNLDYKDAALGVIANNSIEDGRETALMKLQGGAPYKDMLHNIFPRLRVAICKVQYSIKNFNLEEAREVIKTRPQNLSLNEMFLVANSYAEDSQDYMDIFETAVRMYPENGIANLNAAAAAISRKDFVLAEKYLGRVDAESYPAEYYNTIGTLSLMKGEYDQAEIYLNKASSYNSDAAVQNLDELAKKKEQLKFE